MDRLLTVKEAGELLQLNIFSVYEMARNGVLPSVRLGRAIRFRPEALDAWLASGGVISRAPTAEQTASPYNKRRTPRRTAR
jgi:excisionase family DNA binding protein